MDDDLRRHMTACYGDDRCTCRHEVRALGVLYGVSFGHGWVRLDDNPACPHHGRPQARTTPSPLTHPSLETP